MLIPGASPFSIEWGWPIPGRPHSHVLGEGNAYIAPRALRLEEGEQPRPSHSEGEHRDRRQPSAPYEILMTPRSRESPARRQLRSEAPSGYWHIKRLAACSIAISLTGIGRRSTGSGRVAIGFTPLAVLREEALQRATVQLHPWTETYLLDQPPTQTLRP